MPGFCSFTQGFGSPSRFNIVMLSTPPPIAASAPPITICCAAMAMAWSPEEQKRFTVVPATDAGSPARTSATRATLLPWAPFGCAQPRITSSISFGSSWGALPSTSLMQWAARSSGRVMLNEPRWDFASGVRELATTTASLLVGLVSLERGAAAAEYTRRPGDRVAAGRSARRVVLRPRSSDYGRAARAAIHPGACQEIANGLEPDAEGGRHDGLTRDKEPVQGVVEPERKSR